MLRGAKVTSLRGGWHHPCQQAPFVCLCLHRYASRLVRAIGAFAGVPRLRHASVESGIRLIGPEAWHSCRQLRIVKLPPTVVSISDNAFRSCKLLNSVTAPGCREFGYKAFDECCSLQWVYTTEDIANRFSSCTKFGHYLFRGCINLAEFTLYESPSPDELLPPTARELALGCLSSTGIATLALPQSFKVIGAHACDNCLLLKKVDLSNTQIEESLPLFTVRASLKFVSRKHSTRFELRPL